MDEVGLKLSTMKDTDLRIQNDRRSWMKLIEGDDHRLMKAVSRLVDQRRDGHLILPWTQDQLQATKAYYSTVEGFLTSNPLLSNLRRVAGHIVRERGMYNFDGGFVLREKNGDACADSLMNGHWEELAPSYHSRSSQLPPAHTTNH